MKPSMYFDEVSLSFFLLDARQMMIREGRINTQTIIEGMAKHKECKRCLESQHLML